MCEAAGRQTGEGQNVRRDRMVVMRHGRRLDTDSPTWHLSSATPWDTPLSSRGLEDLRQVAAKLQELGRVDVVECSPFTRCLQTARRVVQLLRDAAAAQGLEDDVRHYNNMQAHLNLQLCEVYHPELLHRTMTPPITARLRRWGWQAQYERRAQAELAGTAKGATAVAAGAAAAASRSAAAAGAGAAGALASAPPLQLVLPRPGAPSEWPKFPESLSHAKQRYRSALAEIGATHRGTVLVVTHGCAVDAAVQACPDLNVYVEQVHPGGFVVWQRSPSGGWVLDRQLPWHNLQCRMFRPSVAKTVAAIAATHRHLAPPAHTGHHHRRQLSAGGTLEKDCSDGTAAIVAAS